MRVTKLIGNAPAIDAEGKWSLFCQVLRGNSYVYGVIVCDTLEEAFAIKVGQIIEPNKFDHRIKNV